MLVTGFRIIVDKWISYVKHSIQGKWSESRLQDIRF